jgi:hypothetical protein
MILFEEMWYITGTWQIVNARESAPKGMILSALPKETE